MCASDHLIVTTATQETRQSLFHFANIGGNKYGGTQLNDFLSCHAVCQDGRKAAEASQRTHASKTFTIRCVCAGRRRDNKPTGAPRKRARKASKITPTEIQCHAAVRVTAESERKDGIWAYTRVSALHLCEHTHQVTSLACWQVNGSLTCWVRGESRIYRSQQRLKNTYTELSCKLPTRVAWPLQNIFKAMRRIQRTA